MTSKIERVLRDEAEHLRKYAPGVEGYGYVDTTTSNWVARILVELADRLSEPESGKRPPVADKSWIKWEK